MAAIAGFGFSKIINLTNSIIAKQNEYNKEQ
jgi:hypothetical protein